MDTREDAIELLNMTHEFPCAVMVKAIGKNADDFPLRVVWVIRDELGLSFDPAFRSREATGGRHIAVTIEPEFESAEQVLDLYEALKQVDGVVMVM